MNLLNYVVYSISRKISQRYLFYISLYKRLSIFDIIIIRGENMLKYSIIVPVWNVEKYVDKCLKSIINQTYENFEVIIVNDGTEDNSQKMIDKYVKKDKRISSYIKPNGGLSDARNFGVKYVKGDYIIFVDSDDYINKELLYEVNKECEKYKGIDIVKFQGASVNERGKIIQSFVGHEFSHVNPREVFTTLVADEMFEPAWLYAFNTKFWVKNKFLFPKGKLHEDFGLIPYVVIMANSMSAMPYYGYNYVVRGNSIITTNNREKNITKTIDVLYHFDNLSKLVDKTDFDIKIKQIFKSFLANEIINKARIVQGEDLNNYIKELKKRKVAELLRDDTLLQKIKKLLVKLNMKFYIKRMMR